MLVLVALLSFPAAASAENRYWVSPGGADVNPGTKEAPFESLHRAQKAVRRSLRRRPRQDVFVILRGGVHRLSKPLRLTARDSARHGQRVVYRAFRGERPVVSGGVRVEGWSRFQRSAGIWRARVGKLQSRELYVNGRRAIRARTDAYPSGFLPSWNSGGADSGIQYLPTIEPGGLNPVAWGDPTEWTNVADVEAVILTQWKAMSVPLRSVSPARGSTPGLIRLVEPGWKNANLFRGADNEPGLWSFWQVTRFENAYQFLDSPGEWYLDQQRGWLYYMPRRGEDMRTADVVLPVLKTLVQGSGTAKRPLSNITFRGLTFSHATWLKPSGPNGYVSDQGGFHVVGNDRKPNTIGHLRQPAATPGNLSFRFAHRIRFIDNRFTHLGAVGLSLGTGSHKSLVKGNVFSDTGSSALQLSGINKADHHPRTRAQASFGNTISGNLLSRVARAYPDAPGIFAGFSSRTRIVDNTIEDVPWSGIALGWGWGLLDPGGFPGLPGATEYQWGHWGEPTQNRNNLVAGNTIRDFLGLLWDGGAIYTTGFQGTDLSNGLVIRDNTTYDKRPNAGGNTFYTDGGSRYVTVKDNTSYDNPIGTADFGPPPRSGDPLPYPEAPSEGNGLPYGSEIGGCRTYGDIRYRKNAWFEAPMQAEIPQYNDIYEEISGGELRPYSAEGFFNVCPYAAGGTNFPTNLSFVGNVIYPAEP